MRILLALAWLVPITWASTVTVDFSKVIRTSRTVTTLQARGWHKAEQLYRNFNLKLGVADYIHWAVCETHSLPFPPVHSLQRGFICVQLVCFCLNRMISLKLGTPQTAPFLVLVVDGHANHDHRLQLGTFLSKIPLAMAKNRN